MKYKYTKAQQEGGDDGYCYVIRMKKSNRELINGLTARECTYYRQRFELEIEKGERDSYYGRLRNDQRIQ